MDSLAHVHLSIEARQQLDEIKTNGIHVGLPTESDPAAIRSSIRLMRWYIQQQLDNKQIALIDRKTGEIKEVELDF